MRLVDSGLLKCPGKEAKCTAHSEMCCWVYVEERKPFLDKFPRETSTVWKLKPKTTKREI